MKYTGGQTVTVGDRVSLGKGSVGEVVCVLDSGGYSDAYPESQWGYLKKGVLINFRVLGLIHYPEIEPDVRLLAPGSGREAY
jgi:hypothetical protein